MGRKTEDGRLTMYTTQKQIRHAFWNDHPDLAEDARKAGVLSKRQNFHCATVRSMFVDFLEGLHRSGQVSDALAARATL
jgi:hypothetical protein